MRVLYTGGTGEISLACVESSIAAGHDVTVFNRGRSDAALPDAVRVIRGELWTDAYAALADRAFDVVCQQLAFSPDRIERDIELFRGRISQYVFISSASAYSTPVPGAAITEDWPLENPYWEYSRNKAACEARLMEALAAGDLPVTIVRPSHTYRTRFPTNGIGSSSDVAWRIATGRPVIVHGDGTTLWTVTRSEDYAKPFVRLLGNDRALGQAFHITDDHPQSWNEIYRAVADALGADANIVHVPIESLVRANRDWEGPLRGDCGHSVFFDNSKVRAVAGDWTCEIGLDEGCARAAACWAREAADFEPDPEVHALLDRICAERSAPGSS